MDSLKEFKENHEENTLLYIAVAFLLGLVIGFILSPVKNGLALGSYNGAYNTFKNSNNVSGKKCKCDKKKCKCDKE